jgi:L-lactate dehydrogenase complex protein LldF
MNAFARQFKNDAARITRDLRHRTLIQTGLKKYEAARDAKKSKFQSWEDARQTAAEIKWDAVNHLDKYLAEFADKLETRGAQVHWASASEQAREIILRIVKEKKARSIIKSKVMTGEEIHLNEALEKEGFDVVESDLGEYIVQLRHEAPYHFVFPAMHLARGEISDLFQRELGTAPTDSAEELTMIARRVLRDKYIKADIGISGANFAIAETGMISITENEGNARLTCALPKVHIALLGIEKVLPRFEDLVLFLPMLATAGAGQSLTCYNSFYGGPRQPGDSDGPEEFHVVLLDNKRTHLLADAEQRDALHCIRCGACLNVCPIYRNIGGHAYGTTYQGPIGSVITPHLRGLQDWKHLSAASTLCGACSEACPVKINLHHHLLHNRRNAIAQKPVWWEKLGFNIFAFVVNRSALYALAKPLARFGQIFHPLIKGTRLDPARGWTRSRELPRIAPQTFKEYWRNRK